MLSTLRISKASLWFQNNFQSNKNYNHRLVKEVPQERTDFLLEFKEIIQEAHADVVFRYKKVLSYSLEDPDIDIASSSALKGYPSKLHPVTVQGYFGEIMAGFIAQNFEIHGIDNWEVPVFLFRYHDQAFQALEKSILSDMPVKTTVGRTGDDCLAFVRDSKCNITKILFCEAKCTLSHNTQLIDDAHKKLNSSVPVDIFRLIEILRDYSVSPKHIDASNWVEALSVLWFSKIRQKKDYQQLNMICYTCGQSPIIKNTWLDINKPHVAYNDHTPLEAVEVHITNISEILDICYGEDFT